MGEGVKRASKPVKLPLGGKVPEWPISLPGMWVSVPKDSRLVPGWWWSARPDGRVMLTERKEVTG